LLDISNILQQLYSRKERAPNAASSIVNLQELYLVNKNLLG